ncbi:CRTAC1 family protein [Gimesia panareensis]|uniref:FG-GAP repeat protein n=1 Tax=Gimesia panareensis TaxID=2527978 RepID=A0A518AA50_9PLAN|nr:CRTAC1 family protein [Gimesia panareensis]QDT28735.1 FG-GAP repeat protein [Gimesia panareensis]QDU51584.1 FG-GAP repeat protein [Gimesia panareensis]
MFAHHGKEIACLLLLWLLPFCAGSGCSDEPAVSIESAHQADENRSEAASAPTATVDLTSPFRFTEIAKASGIDFTYYGNPSPEHYMVEQNGGGVACLDYDLDGQLDLFFSNGSHFEQPAEKTGQTHQLYRATGQQGKSLQYEPVAALAGVNHSGFGMGVACGDYDNDGFVDLYLCAYGKNIFWQNNGDGTFTEITDLTGTGDAQHWGTSAAFADLDGDGDLDLYVTNYVDYDKTDPPCYTTLHGERIKISCGPIGRTAQPDILFENSGDGLFVDRSAAAGITRPEAGKGLAVQIVDLDDDGLLDIFVANDMTDNFFFHNTGKLTFEEQALLQGVAVGDNGMPQSSMGIACADFNRNGRFDLFVTNFENSPNDFYEQIDSGVFVSSNTRLGLDTNSRPKLAFGTIAADFNLDQWPDLFIANGHIWNLSDGQTEHDYEMTQQVYLNQQGKRFRDVSPTAGPYFQKRLLGRAVASADLDNDGDTDLVTSPELKPVALLRNDSPRTGNSVSVRLIGTNSVREPLGVSLKATIEGVEQLFCIPAGGSFQSSNDPRVIIPTGQARQIDQLTVIWPDGKSEHWKQIPVQQFITLIQGNQ